jgi:hypothetical protein
MVGASAGLGELEPPPPHAVRVNDKKKTKIADVPVERALFRNRILIILKCKWAVQGEELSIQLIWTCEGGSAVQPYKNSSISAGFPQAKFVIPAIMGRILLSVRQLRGWVGE